jgi:MFS transporter, UMF1 family
MATQKTITKNDPKIVNAWCMYDWANSVHNLVIVSGIFPVYYAANAVNAEGGEVINFLGFTAKNTVFFSFAISFAYLVIALINPVLTAISDHSGKKKPFLRAFCYLGAISCMMLYFFTKDNVALGIWAFMFSVMGWTGSVVFYNSYLNEIATEDQFDRISARGFSMGYIGSVLLMIFNLTMLLKPDWYGGISKGMASRVSFLLVGLWWILFAQIPLKILPSNLKSKETNGNVLTEGFKELKKVYHSLSNLPDLKKYLTAFFFFNMGVQTVMFVAALFGSSELKLPQENLITTILLIQLVGILGAISFSRLSNKFGNINSLLVAIVIWIGICIGAYFVTTGNQFYVLAVVVGSVMGGIQALSRSTYAKLIPKDTEDNASYFSFYDFAEKISLVLGTFMFGYIIERTGNMRNSILGILVFFVIGFVLLIVRKPIINSQE